MQQERTALDSTAGSTSFAELLASLTAARSQKTADWTGDSAGNLDGLEDDVATLSYDRALQTHARYKPAADEAPQVAAAVHQRAAFAPDIVALQKHPGALAGRDAVPDRKRKCASVTVRMSETEATQLQHRAAEAGMTISAYLRSCTFEVEVLRAQVKQALTELRTAQTAPDAPGSLPSPRLSWLRLFRRPVAMES